MPKTFNILPLTTCQPPQQHGNNQFRLNWTICFWRSMCLMLVHFQIIPMTFHQLVESNEWHTEWKENSFCWIYWNIITPNQSWRGKFLLALSKMMPLNQKIWKEVRFLVPVLIVLVIVSISVRIWIARSSINKDRIRSHWWQWPPGDEVMRMEWAHFFNGLCSWAGTINILWVLPCQRITLHQSWSHKWDHSGLKSFKTLGRNNKCHLLPQWIILHHGGMWERRNIAIQLSTRSNWGERMSSRKPITSFVSNLQRVYIEITWDESESSTVSILMLGFWLMNPKTSTKTKLKKSKFQFVGSGVPVFRIGPMLLHFVLCTCEVQSSTMKYNFQPDKT